MPRQHRIRGQGIHYHIILRCNNKERLFQQDEDFSKVLEMLLDTKNRLPFALYNYILMNAHMHLLLSTHQKHLIDQIMHDFCFKYAKDYNQRHRRSGHFWAHRYRGRIITSDQHAIAGLRYQHRNPIVAGLVLKPEDWRWSGYNYYAFGVPNDLLEAHPSYLALSKDAFFRQQIYRELVNTTLQSDQKPHLFEGRSEEQSRRFQNMARQVQRLSRALQRKIK